ncbi:hypothetical protein LIER_42613 [Lithospermum erythrorhizon]|uniref:Uncharacterized protein n=1 Tax=Lithospermum erythrorhizon TaxID=34254 RepID=A0AAV3NQF3_LITER
MLKALFHHTSCNFFSLSLEKLPKVYRKTPPFPQVTYQAHCCHEVSPPSPPKKVKIYRGSEVHLPFSSPPPSPSSARPVVGSSTSRALAEGNSTLNQYHGFGRRSYTRPPQGGGTGARAPRYSFSSYRGQQLPLGAFIVGPRLEEGQGGESCCLPGCSCRSSEDGRLHHTYCQDSPLRCRRIGDIILSDVVLNFQDWVPTLLALDEEYMQRYPTGWLDNTIPLPPVTEILPAP